MGYRRNPNARIATDLAELRKVHRDALTKALGGMHIDEIDVDKLYAKKLRNINIMEEFFNGQKR